MCGIVGGIRFRPGPSHVPSIRRMASAIAHRGPDASGFAVLNNGQVVLGHVRLSIVDLHAGPQPMSLIDNSVTISFNGEIYDHAEHRAFLETRGHRFRTTTDTEVILALYKEFGLDFFSYLNGEFAFLLWDYSNRRLIAVRDRYGVKPLYFHRSPSQMYFCSENKGFMTLPEIDRHISSDYLTGSLMTAYPSAVSAFSGVEALRPGHYMTIEGGRVGEQKAYFEASFPTVENLSMADAAEGVVHHFTQAVKRRLVADVPVCAYLSGGIDSALVCGIAASQGQPLKAFNVGFSNSVYDEAAQARDIAKHFSVPFDTISCPPERMAQNLVSTLYHTESALHNASSIGKFCLSERVNAEGYRVALTGEGADEILAGYPFFKLEAIWRMIMEGGERETQAKELLRRFQKLESRSEGVLWNRGQDWRTAPQPFGFPSAMYTRAHVYGRLISQMIHPEVLRSGKRPQHVYERHFDHNRLGNMHPLHASMVVTYNQLSNYIFPNLGDRLEMAHHVEGRTPFLDKEFCEFASKIPPRHLIDLPNLREKHVLHEAFDKILPKKMQSEHKHPFLAPSWKGMRETKTGKALFEHYLSSKELNERGLCNTAGVRRLQHLWRATPKQTVLHRRLDAVMGTVLSIQILHDHFVAHVPKHDAEFKLQDMSPG